MLEKQPPILVFIGICLNKSCQPVEQAQRSIISALEMGSVAGEEEVGTGRVGAGIGINGFEKTRDQALDGALSKLG